MAYDKPEFKKQYENYIGRKWIALVDGEYFDDISPIDGSVLTKVAKSNSKDIDLAVVAASKATISWGKTSVGKRSGYALSNRARHVVMMAGEIEWKSLADFISILGGMIAEKNIMGLVLGWPRHMNGDEGKNCRVVRRLAHQLSGHQATARPILFWDERLSTKAVERAAEGDIGRNLL